MSWDFSSELGEYIKAYIDFKHSMNVRFRGGEAYLRNLDIYCAKNNIRSLSKETVRNWIIEWEQNVPSPHRNWISSIRGFGKYMQTTIDPEAYVLPDGFGKSAVRTTPYLFSNEEVELFFEAAAMYDYPNSLGYQAKAFFGLMAACGLRTCEVRRLKVCDVDTSSGTIEIKWSKGPRSRRLFIDDAVATLLNNCDKKNKVLFPGRITFFVSCWGNCVSEYVPGMVFKRIWVNAGLEWQNDAKRPRPYDFRHRFAFANIERWAADGKDVMAMMPYLMRYMGHSSIESTCYYLHISPNFLTKYAKQVTDSGRVLPEVGFDD